MVSHHGAWADHQFPQNSLAGLKRAIDIGYKGIEFDVLKTKDNKFVLAHDDDITKISNCKGKISNMLLLEVKKCSINKNTTLPLTQLLLHKVKFPKLIISLEELRDQLFADSRLELIWLDFKQTDDAMVPAISDFLKTISDTNILNKMVVNSGSVSNLVALRKINKSVKYSLEGLWGSEPLTDYKKYFDGIGITHDYISLNVGIHLGQESIWKVWGREARFWKQLDDFMVEAQHVDAVVIGWTVNNSNKIEKLKKLNFDYLLSDRLDLH